MTAGPTIRIGRHVVGAGQPAFVIAEAGVNHNGDPALAERLIDEAHRAGADCVKFQTFKAEEVATASAPKAAYQLKVTDPGESQLEMLRSLELPESAFRRLKEQCDALGILFLSTPYSFRDADLLERIGVEAYKVASGQLTELPFLEYLARKGKPIILSTGMGTLAEVEAAVSTIRAHGNPALVVLQCTTNYPAAIQDANLRAMDTIAQRCGVVAGYSDHTQGPLTIIGAVARGAAVIEKHFTLDRSLPGPDHRCSMEPNEFAQLMQDIRLMESALGSGVKEPTPAEVQNAKGMKRSIATSSELRPGTVLTRDMLTFKRPASGMAPNLLPKILGRRLAVAVPADTLLREEHLEPTTDVSRRERT